MKPRDHQNILATLENEGFLSELDRMKIGDLKKYLSDKGYQNLYEILTITLLVIEVMKGKASTQFNVDSEKRSPTDFILKYDLSKDEFKTLQMIAKGMTNQEIANGISISIEGVRKMVQRICNKLEVGKRVQAAVIAAKEGIV